MDRSPLTLDDLLRLKAEGVGYVWQPAFGAGELREGLEFTPDDIACLHDNFQALSTGDRPRHAVQVGPSHDAASANLWPWGVVTADRLDPGHVWSLKLDHLPKRVIRAIKDKIITAVSVEIDPVPPFGIAPARWLIPPNPESDDETERQGYSPTLVGVAFLGLEQPQLKWLRGMASPQVYSARRVVRRPNRTTLVFSEMRAVDEESIAIVGRIKVKWPDLPDEFLASLTPEQLKQLDPGEGEGEAPPEGETVAADMPDRETMIADILAADPARDRAELEAMDDAALFALWQEVTGGAAVASEFSQQTDTEGTTVATATPNPTPQPTTPPPGTPRPTPDPVTPPAPKPGVAMSEQDIERIARRVMVNQLQPLAKRAVTFAAAPSRKDAKIQAFKAWQQAQGLYLPADEDTSGDAKRPCLYTRLRRRDDLRTMKFSAGGKAVTRTDLDEEIDRLKEELPKLRKPQKFSAGQGGDLLATPAASPQDRFTRIKAEYERDNTRKASGPTLHQRLGLAPPPSAR